MLLSGFGSKVEMLEEFAREVLTDGVVIRVKGYLPSVSMKGVCGAIIGKGMQIKCTSVYDQCMEIAQYYTYYGTRKLYLIVHNIEGLALRNESSQTALSLLGRAKNIHIVASMDHISTPFMWTEEHRLAFHWHRVDAPTYKPYEDEIPIKLPIAGLAQERSIDGVKGIVQALTPHQKSVLNIVAKHQMDKSLVKLKYAALRDTCRNSLNISSSILQSIVAELASHEIITCTVKNNVEYVKIPLPDRIIRNAIFAEG